MEILNIIAEINLMDRYRNDVSSARGSVDYAQHAYAVKINHLMKTVRDIQEGKAEVTPLGLALEILEVKKFEEILEENKKTLAVKEKLYTETKEKLYQLAHKIKGA